MLNKTFVSVLILMLLSSLCAVYGQNFTIKSLNLSTNDLIYDAHSDRIYATVPSSAGAVYGNSIVTINPYSLQIEKSVFVGSEPNKLAISDDGSYIYIGLDGSAKVRRFIVATQKSDIQFELGSDIFLGLFYVEDMEVMPGHPETVAVSRRNLGFSPRHEGVALFDNGVMRPSVTQGHTGSNVIEFANASTLFGYNNETTEFGLRDIKVLNNGLEQGSVYPNIISDFGTDFTIHNNVAYSTNGRIISLNNSIPSLEATLNDVNGLVAFDATSDRVCFTHGAWWTGQQILIKRYNPNNFIIADTIAISSTISTAAVLSFVTWGTNRYAFNTADGKVVIVNGGGATPVKDNFQISTLNIQTYPNPTINLLKVEKDFDARVELFLTNAAGQNVLQTVWENNERTKILDLNHCPTGIYYLAAKHESGIQTYKISKI